MELDLKPLCASPQKGKGGEEGGRGGGVKCLNDWWEMLVSVCTFKSKGKCKDAQWRMGKCEGTKQKKMFWKMCARFTQQFA